MTTTAYGEWLIKAATRYIVENGRDSLAGFAREMEMTAGQLYWLEQHIQEMEAKS